jgi:hypothetical protein
MLITISSKVFFLSNFQFTILVITAICNDPELNEEGGAATAFVMRVKM